MMQPDEASKVRAMREPTSIPGIVQRKGYEGPDIHPRNSAACESCSAWPPFYSLTRQDGYDVTIATNVLSHFLLARELVS